MHDEPVAVLASLAGNFHVAKLVKRPRIVGKKAGDKDQEPDQIRPKPQPPFVTCPVARLKKVAVLMIQVHTARLTGIRVKSID